MRRRGTFAVAAILMLAAACSNGDGDSAGDPSAPTRAPSDEPVSFPATLLPQARTEVSGALWNGHLAVAGGLTASGRPSERLDLLDARGRWSRGPDLPSQRDHASLAVLDNRLYLVGGIKTDGSGSRPTDEVWSLGPGDRRWRREPALRSPRGALATVSDGDQLWAMGGIGDRGVLDTVELFDPDDAPRRWRNGPRLQVAREHTAAAANSDTVYAIAGRQGSLESNLTSVESLTHGTWQSAPQLQHSRGGIGAAAVDEVPCVAGGEEPSGTIGSVECLVSGRWQTIATLATPRHGLAVVAVGRALHVLGGGPEPGLTVSDAHEIVDVSR